MTVIDTTIADKAPTAAKPVRQRLIDAAEQLFAEHGWNGVSIRTIANAADVSLAALNYHFGEKENLLAEIFAARARPIAEKRMRLLTEVNANPSATLEDVIEAFLRPALATGSASRACANACRPFRRKPSIGASIS
jgi:AcrR family transcriptional regulator